ncbi:Radical SAM domain-containing protein [Desulfonema limicola]|uniref:Radical SAM domain-containing protein n=1 Tax=Desulfonema limicola TaxID=45656 RepID=A0A975GIP9_9BACT|nr:radical SAM protein [Desulfonema limicola]QTA82676.1 Radical SAM domain-containing protein [Desulfonema limicola]
MCVHKKNLIIPVFIPHAGCPHKCAFCNQKTITHVNSKLPSQKQLQSRIQEFLKYKSPKHNKVQISFYGGNFLGLQHDDIQYLLTQASSFIDSGDVDSLRFSTRPDTITPENLNVLNDFKVSAIELGVQSMDNRVLELSKRGHTALDTKKAVHLLKERGYETGLQMMTGLPGDTPEKAMNTGHKLVELLPDFVRIYPAVVLENSLLAKLYRDGKYCPMPVDECVTLVKKLYLLFTQNNIPVIRMGLQSSLELDSGTAVLAGPYHPAFGHMVYSEIFLDKVIAKLKLLPGLEKTVSIAVHPANVSRLQGLKNRNIEILKKMFHIEAVKIIQNSAVSKADVII